MTANFGHFIPRSSEETTMKTTRESTKVAVVGCSPLREAGAKYVGKTIRELRSILKDKLDIEDNLPVSLSKDGGKTYGNVGENYHLKSGDVLDFSRAPGTKCSIVKCTGCGKEHCLEHGECV